MSTLFGHSRQRWPGTRSLVPQTICPFCYEDFSTESWTQLPLLRHGGYGEGVETTSRQCRCATRSIIKVQAVSPR